jgi:DNA (cytosine-5)-methyltransferase 1
MKSATASTLFDDALSANLDQQFAFDGDGGVVRTISTPRGQTVWRLSNVDSEVEPASTAWSKLRLSQKPEGPKAETPLRIVDVFSGAGGFGAGFRDAAEAHGFRARAEAAIDIDAAALASHAKNLGTRRKLVKDASMCVDYGLRTDGNDIAFAYPPEILDPMLREIATCDVVIGGPPCQGHSNLNNHTRRADFRNGLYFVVPALAVAFGAPIVMIENVTMVLRDKQNVVARTKALLAREGYDVAEMVLKSEEFGVAQLRRRHFLVGVKGAGRVDPNALEALKMAPLTALDAIGDLADLAGTSDYDRQTALTDVNADRVRYLFDNDLYDLPNSERPECHREGHTYPSVYGRMKPDEPAATITGGFLQPGQGRFIHPTRARSLTPHEGARLQGFADDHRFIAEGGREPTRKELAQMIGDAVPPPLAFAAAMVALAAYTSK